MPGDSSSSAGALEILCRLEPVVAGERPITEDDFEALERLLELAPYRHHQVVMVQLPEEASLAYEKWVARTQDEESRAKRRGFGGRISGVVW